MSDFENTSGALAEWPSEDPQKHEILESTDYSWSGFNDIFQNEPEKISRP